MTHLVLIADADAAGPWKSAASRLGDAVVTLEAGSVAEALAAGEGIDAAVVGTCAEAMEAVNAGLHVLVESPVGETVEEVRALLDACEKAGAHLAMGGGLRHAPGNAAIRRRLDAGKLGRPGLLRVHRWSSGGSIRIVGDLFADVDLALDWFSVTPREVYAMSPDEGAGLQVHLGFPGGGMALLDCTTSLPDGQRYDSLTLVGSDGAAYADDHHNTHLLLAGEQTRALFSRARGGRVRELEMFLSGLAAPTLPTELLEVHRVLDAIGRSSSTRSVVELGGEGSA